MQAGPMRAARWLGGLGATAGPLLDGLHTHGGATRYAHPQLWLAEWWVVPLFCAAALAIGLGRLGGERLRPSPAPRPGQVALGLGVFIAAYAFTAFAPLDETSIAAVVAALFALSFTLVDRTALGLASAALTGFGGWVVEHTLVAHGFFFHRDLGLDGVALWIPPLYWCAACALGALARALAQPPNVKPTTS